MGIGCPLSPLVFTEAQRQFLDSWVAGIARAHRASECAWRAQPASCSAARRHGSDRRKMAGSVHRAGNPRALRCTTQRST